MKKPKWWRRFWVEAAVCAVVLSVLNIAFYLLGIIDLYGLAQGTFGIFSIILVTYALRHIILDVLSDKTRLRIMKIAYTAGGASFGVIFGGILGVFITWAFNIPIPEVWFSAFLFFGVAPIVGALFGYWMGKRRGFRRLSI